MLYSTFFMGFFLQSTNIILWHDIFRHFIFGPFRSTSTLTGSQDSTPPSTLTFDPLKITYIDHHEDEQYDDVDDEDEDEDEDDDTVISRTPVRLLFIINLKMTLFVLFINLQKRNT